MNKRVLIFSTAYFPLVGGAEVALKEITDRLPDWQFDLLCARIKPGLPSAEKIGNVMVYRCGIGRPIDKFLFPVWGALRALTLTNQEEGSVIWSMMASFGGFAAWIYTWFRPKTKMLLTLQEGDPTEHYVKRAGKLAWMHTYVFRRADALHAISTFLAAWGKKMGFRGEPEIIPNGVETHRFAASLLSSRREEIRTSWGIGKEEIAVITTSRLSLKNAVDDLIRAMVFLPESYKAIIAGEGEDHDMLRSLVEQEGLASRVVFLGHCDQKILPELLQSSDIFVRASLSEGLGISFLEAMAAGLPIVGTAVGGITDFLVDGQTGVFCEPRHPESIARAVQRIQSEPGLRQKLIVDGRHLVEQTYTWDAIVPRIEATFKKFSLFRKREVEGVL